MWMNLDVIKGIGIRKTGWSPLGMGPSQMAKFIVVATSNNGVVLCLTGLNSLSSVNGAPTPLISGRGYRPFV